MEEFMKEKIEKAKTFVKDVSNLAKDQLKDHVAKLQTIPGECRKGMDTVKSKVQETKSESIKKIDELIGQVSVKEIVEKYGPMKVNEIIEKAKTSDFFKHGEVLKKELYVKLGLASTEEIAQLKASLTAIKKDVSDLKKLKEELKEIKSELKDIRKKAAETK
jgi:hypothetical protein